MARGGGSLADLLCFCEETLCRTVALLGVPVIASVGHHTDRTLLDDVAAVSCSTPTHAAEAAVGVHCCAGARWSWRARPARLQDARPPRGARRERARWRGLSRAPAAQLARQRARLHQQLREVRAAGRRRVVGERAAIERAGAGARAGQARRTVPTAGDGARASWSGWRWRWRHTTRSARSSGATRWCESAAASRCATRLPRARRRAVRLRFADGIVGARIASGDRGSSA